MHIWCLHPLNIWRHASDFCRQVGGNFNKLFNKHWTTLFTDYLGNIWYLLLTKYLGYVVKECRVGRQTTGRWNGWFATFKSMYPAHQRVKRTKKQLICLALLASLPLVLDFKGAGILDFVDCLTWKDSEHSPSRNLAIIFILCWHAASIMRSQT